MRRPGGYGTIVEPGKPTIEFDTVTCCHCGGLIHVKPGSASTTYLVFDTLLWQWREEPGAGCFRCGMKPVCLECHADGRCRPLERQLEAAERQLRG